MSLRLVPCGIPKKVMIAVGNENNTNATDDFEFSVDIDVS